MTEMLVKAEVDMTGRVHSVAGDGPAMEPREVWAALVEGRLGIASRGAEEERRYVLFENAPESYALHALSRAELDVLAHAIRGTPTKVMAYSLGRSSSTVSSRLASAASKMGVGSRTELVRIAALLSRDANIPCSEAALTDAERNVLELVRHGLSNDAIAKRRARSVRTVANQVASLLRKTSCPSRRALLLTARAAQ